MAKARGKARRWAELAAASRQCQACPLYASATQTVFGDGPVTAPLMLVGEQPGDEEDQEGLPFVGPAGRLLRRALEEATIDPATVYMTNVVKHFKWKPGAGWKRLHQKPNRREVSACLPWLEQEVALVNPALIVTLGSTASQALLGAGVRVTRDRRSLRQWGDHPVMIGVHPSSVLRARDSASRQTQYRDLVGDLEAAAAFLRRGSNATGGNHVNRAGSRAR